MTIMSQFIRKRLSKRGQKPDQLIAHSLTNMSSGKFSRVSELLKYYHVNERQLERRFSSVVGISPRNALKIFRFQSAMEILKRDPKVKYTTLALNLGYFDQAHFIKDVKSLSGYTPSTLQRKLLALPVNRRGTTNYLIDVAPLQNNTRTLC